MLGKLAQIFRIAEPHPASEEWTGSWIDEHGSRMDLICRGQCVNGSYHTTFDEVRGREIFPLTGYFQGRLISFTVYFGAHGSLACWIGELGRDERGATVLRTAWLLTERLTARHRPAALSGNNEFTRLKA